ncbi:MAG: Asp-tRNA(Asn)/Glu-tRNA(Gln) amidotransferase subunit GatC [Patescibacteria group bacterium]
MALSSEEVRQLADLARLELDENEVTAAEKDLDKILGFVDRLKKVETQGVEPASMPARTEWRQDIAQPVDELARETILANFPARSGDLLKAPGVFEKPKGK